MKRAYYSSSLSEFCDQGAEQILGIMVQENSFDLTIFQREAWIEQTQILQNALCRYDGKLYLEFDIPRMGRRIDAVVIIESIVFVIEFKVGAKSYEAGDLDQVVDYALDLHNFHEGSHEATLCPVLVATKAPTFGFDGISTPENNIFPPVCCNASNLSEGISKLLEGQSQAAINPDVWEASRYKPTPTIIEATLALYSGHSVADISRNDASAENLSHTSSSIAKIIQNTKSNSEKAVIIVTGVPGAGKTLVGLNVATTHIDPKDELYSVFLSGNGPLVKILQEALARDKVSRFKERGEKIKKGEALSQVKAFVQNVHHFRDDGLADMYKPPVEHVALFDEAQRAWTREQTVKFMREKKNQHDFRQSEPEFLISCMDRHSDWAVVVCLVGGGQEINTGEAGIGEWFEAVEKEFPYWKIYISDQLMESEYGGGEVVKRATDNPRVKFESKLHLSTSVRSFRSEKVSSFVKKLLDIEEQDARNSYHDINVNYPIVITRNLEKAKNWVKEKARGTERYGMVVSSQAERLKPYAIDVRVKTNPVHWFLNGKDDVRSSYYLEDVATEFDVQGLELDWVCMAWDADFRYVGGNWENWSFRGNKWQRIKKMERKLYQKNAYRVLLTRARQGMVIFIPEGDEKDHTRPSRFYDPTYEYLMSIGIKEI